MKIVPPNEQTAADKAFMLEQRAAGMYFLVARNGWYWAVYEIGTDGVVRPVYSAQKFWRKIGAMRVAQELIRLRNGARWELMGQLEVVGDDFTSETDEFLTQARTELEIWPPADTRREIRSLPGWRYVAALAPHEIMVASQDGPLIVDTEKLTVRRIEP